MNWNIIIAFFGSISAQQTKMASEGKVIDMSAPLGPYEPISVWQDRLIGKKLGTAADSKVKAKHMWTLRWTLMISDFCEVGTSYKTSHIKTTYRFYV